MTPATHQCRVGAVFRRSEAVDEDCADSAGYPRPVGGLRAASTREWWQ